MTIRSNGTNCGNFDGNGGSNADINTLSQVDSVLTP